MEKKCSKCGHIKCNSLFAKAKSRADGLQSKCKDCNKKYREENREKINKYLSEYSERNRDKLLIQKRQYRIDNLEKIREKDRIWSRKNPEKVKANQELQWSKNRQKYYAKAVERYTKRRKIDSLYDLKCRLSHRVRLALKGIGLTKSKRTIEMIGCSWEDLVKHIERQFTTGMSWDNRSEWHIDHIIPLATATCEDDIIRLNHFTNLRPLWAEDNLRKSDKLEHLI